MLKNDQNHQQNVPKKYSTNSKVLSLLGAEKIIFAAKCLQRFTFDQKHFLHWEWAATRTDLSLVASFFGWERQRVQRALFREPSQPPATVDEVELRQPDGVYSCPKFSRSLIWEMETVDIPNIQFEPLIIQLKERIHVVKTLYWYYDVVLWQVFVSPCKSESKC